jgi:tetratricopeptide (TPR) repeat protein
LETTRQYAREKLDEAGEFDALARAHCEAMVELAERLDATAERTPNQIWYAQAYAEMENWWAALEWALHGRGDLRLGQRIAGSLDGLWQWYAEVEGWHWVRAALETVDQKTPPAVRARLELANAKIAGNAGLGHYVESMASAERALAYYTQADDALRLLRAQHWMGRALVYMRRFAEGEAVLHDALRVARTLGAHKRAGGVLETLGLARLFQGDTSGACDLWTDALALLRQSGTRDAECAAFTIHLAEAKFHDGKPEEALRLASDAAIVYRATNYRRGLWCALLNAAAYLVAMGRLDDARSHARETLVLTRELGIEIGSANALQHLGAIAALRSGVSGPDVRKDRVRAARLLGFVEARFAEIELVREYTEQQEYDSVLAALRDELGVADVTKLMGEGGTWNEDHAVAEALLI